MSQLGQKATSAGRFGMSAPPPIADIAGLHAQVRFVPISDGSSCSKLPAYSITSLARSVTAVDNRSPYDLALTPGL
jgi:hypothetical protein